jgi:phosphotransferase system HPr-like phosphotransfer protein
MNNLIFLVASLTKTDCDQIKDNPVEIDDHERYKKKIGKSIMMMMMMDLKMDKVVTVSMRIKTMDVMRAAISTKMD